MFERFTEPARRAVVLAQEEARLLHHNYIGTEHVLLGVIHEGEGVAAQALRSLGISLDDARAQVERTIGHGGTVPSGHSPFTPRAKKVLELSLREALELGHDYIGTEHILLGLVREGEGAAAQALRVLTGDLERVRETVLRLLQGRPRVEPPPGLSSRAQLSATSAVPLMHAGQHCSVCGRDLWEVDRYVRGESAVICGDCVAASQAAFERAPEGRRDVVLPPRVFGVEKADPGAAEAIAAAFERVFGGRAPEEETHLMEDGDELRPFVVEAGARMSQFTVVAAHVSRIRFLEPDRAEVRFSVEIDPGPIRISRDGTAIRHEERWVVSRATIAMMLAPTGVHLPPA